MSGAPIEALQRAEEYTKECRKIGIVPVSLDAAAQMIASHSTSQVLVGDRQIATWCSAGLLDGQEHIQMRNSEIGDEAAQAMATRLGKAVLTLDLAGNSVGIRGAEALAAARMPNLESLVLSKNNLGDAALTRLCEGLKEWCAPQLTRLVLAENQISSAGRSLGEAVAVLLRLSLLDLHWNFLRGDGAVGLFEGIAAHQEAGGRLSRLDLAWNCLGNSHSLAGMQALSKALKADFQLLHLDLSYNALPTEACAALAEGLRDNHALLGLHLVGNAADVDPDGFVIPVPSTGVMHSAAAAGEQDILAPASASGPPKEILDQRKQAMQPRVVTTQEREAIRSWFPKLDKDASGSIEASELQELLSSLGMPVSLEEATKRIRRALEEDENKMDIEVFTDFVESIILHSRRKEWESSRREMELERDRSGLEVLTSCWICEGWQPVELTYEGSDEVKAVWAFTSMNKYERATKLSKDPDSNTFRCQIMFPPDQVCVVLQVDESGTALVDGLDTAELEEPVTIRLRQDEKLPVPEDNAPKTVKVSKVSVLQLGGGRRHKRNSPQCPHAPKRAVVVDDPSNPGGFCVKPRIAESEYIAIARKDLPPWTFETSIFAAWHFEDADLLNHAFGNDWPHTKVHRFLKDRREQEEVANVFKAHYSSFIRLYRRCAASSSDGTTFMGVDMVTCSELIASIGLIDDKFCRQPDVDTMFIAARVREKGAANRQFAMQQGDALMRFQFLEFLLRVALARYLKTGEAEKPGDALEMLFSRLQKQVLPIQSTLEKFLKEFHTEECDTVLRKYENLLHEVFRVHSGSWSKPGVNRLMCCKEFEAILTGADAFNTKFRGREVTYAMQIGLQLYADEYFETEFAQMTFLEYIHGLGAAAFLGAEQGPLAKRLGRLVARVVDSLGLSSVLRGLR